MRAQKGHSKSESSRIVIGAPSGPRAVAIGDEAVDAAVCAAGVDASAAKKRNASDTPLARVNPSFIARVFYPGFEGVGVVFKIQVLSRDFILAWSLKTPFRHH